MSAEGDDREPSWDDLRVLEALDRLGSAGRAARELGVSVSKVYRRVAQLEEIVAAPCIERGAGKGKLTDTGRALAAIGRQTAAAFAAVNQRLRLAAKELEGEVSLTTVEGFVPLIAPVLRGLTERHPALRVALQVSDQGPSVRRREVDLALAVVPRPPEGLWGKRLFTIGYGVFGTASALRAAPRRWVVLGRPLHTTPQALWEAEHARDVVLRTASLGATLAFVRDGIGVAILPRRLAALHPDLVEVPESAAQLVHLERPAWLLTHPDLRDVPRVRVVMDALGAALC